VTACHIYRDPVRYYLCKRDEHDDPTCNDHCLLPLDLCVWKFWRQTEDNDESQSQQYLNAELVSLLTNGIPPFHLACMHPCTSWFPFRMKTLETLSDILPIEQWMHFYQGMLPFHCACHAGAPKSILQWCAQQNPDALHTSTMDTADTPLHCYLSSWSLFNHNVLATGAATTSTTMMATRNHVGNQIKHSMISLSAVEFLVEEHRAALLSPNQQGFLPLHVAVMCGAPLDVLFYLACENPELLLRSN